ncbi:ANTAR domain-containing protein [Streptomyces sp. NPDC046716]|uniref:ANTAR domain-containing protein n=1 Tax=Streptomyces sp. NPDC046716 TaxID=3157093 RepID=UPI0033D63028
MKPEHPRAAPRSAAHAPGPRVVAPRLSTSGRAPDAPSAEGMHAELRGLREHVASLNAQVRARTQIAFAEGLLVGRYALADREEAFAVMRTASQHANVKLHQLAAALIVMAPPAPGATHWFPGRTASPAPSLAGLRQGRMNPRNQGEVLSAALRRAMQITGADAGNVQLYEAGILRLERHQGHSQAFLDYFAFVQEGTSCARAAVSDRQVTVRDIATASLFDDETRQVLLDAGYHACHSIPLASAAGVVRGVLNVHHHAPLETLDQARLSRFEELRRAVGAWLDWHQRTVVLDALEHLHRTAAGPGTRREHSSDGG